MTTTNPTENIERICRRLYNEAIANGANDEQAIKAVRHCLADYIKDQNRKEELDPEFLSTPWNAA